MSSTDRWHRDVVLSADESDAIRQWCAGLDADPYSREFASYDDRLRERLNDLPQRLVDAVRDFGRPKSSVGVLRLRGIPVSTDLPPTPGILYSNIRARIGTEPVMLALAMLLGRALSLSHIRDGDRVHNIYPLPEDAETQKASNSALLELHSEMAFLESAPDALAILCLRATDSPPATSFVDLRSAWDELGERDRSLLQEREFSFRYSGPEPDREFFDLREPLVRSGADGPHFQYDYLVRGVTPEHEAALTTFRKQVADQVSELTLATGDLVLINNRRMAHGRSPMNPGYAGNDRWLQRCFLQLDRHAPRAMPSPAPNAM